MARIGIAFIMVLGFMALAYYAFDSYTDAIHDRAYADGVSDTNKEALRIAAQKQIADQAKIDEIERRAQAEIASRTASNVEKAIADARKANPECSLTVPPAVLEQLRRNR